MGRPPGGEQGTSGISNIKDLIEKSKERFNELYPDDIRWPCPFCILKSNSKIQCYNHICRDHKNIARNNKGFFSNFCSEFT